MSAASLPIAFWKLHGSGNDFICFNGFEPLPKFTAAQIARICHRHLGVGADGLIILEPSKEADFKMVYYNSDGNEGSMCGNGGRTAAVFAQLLGIGKQKGNFMAYDGLHNYIIHNQEYNLYDVELTMADVDHYDWLSGGLVVNTGSPHYVLFSDHVKTLDVVGRGRSLRYSEAFKPAGTNVNFLEVAQNDAFLRTYERGVEDETLSCGTGVTAAAIALFFKNRKEEQAIQTRGGLLRVKLKLQNNAFTQISLRGPVCVVFSAHLESNISNIEPI